MSGAQSPTVNEIDPSGDLLVKVIKKSNQNRFEVLGSFKVSRSVLAEESDHFRAMLRGPFQESVQSEIELEDETVKSLEVWFRYYHNCMIDEMYNISIRELWNVMAVGRKRFLFNDKLNDWFAAWWTRNKSDLELDDCKELLYPCFQFDHPAAFAYVTRKLAYECAGHIEENNLYRIMFLPQRALNGAKGNLRTKLHEAVYINRKFLSRSCDCKEKALFQFELAIDNTGVWPMEQHMNGKHKISLQDVLDGLENFEYEAPEDGCNFCTSDFDAVVIQPAIKSVSKNFDGLCVDCINLTKKGDLKHDAWTEKKRGVNWSSGCRITHDQPTWYFSFLARRQQEDVFEQERLKRKEEKKRADRDEWERKIKEEREKAQARNGR